MISQTNPPRHRRCFSPEWVWTKSPTKRSTSRHLRKYRRLQKHAGWTGTTRRTVFCPTSLGEMWVNGDWGWKRMLGIVETLFLAIPRLFWEAAFAFFHSVSFWSSEFSQRIFCDCMSSILRYTIRTWYGCYLSWHYLLPLPPRRLSSALSTAEARVYTYEVM